MAFKDWLLSFLPTRTEVEFRECSLDNKADCIPSVGDCVNIDGPSTIDATIRDRLVAQSDQCETAGGYYTKALNLHSAMVIGDGPKVVVTDERITPEDIKHLKMRWQQWQERSCFVTTLGEIRRGAMKSGEGLGVFITSNRQQDPVKLRLRSLNCKRLKSPWRFDDDVKDGIKYDENGEPEKFYIENGTDKPDEHDPNEIVYWFSSLMEEQARGIPELWSTLKWFPKINDFVDAVIDANRLFARMPMVMETSQMWIADEDRENGRAPGPKDKPLRLPTSSLHVPTTPAGTTIKKLQGDAPGTNAKEFLTVVVTLGVSPICMPAILIMGDACDASFSGANIDWEPYIGEVKKNRRQLAPVCTQTFYEWLKEGVRIPGYFGPSVVAAFREDEALGTMDIAHSWRWGRVKCHIDPAKEANARQTDTEACTMTLVETYEMRSEDIEECIETAAKFYGKTVDEYKAILWKKFEKGGEDANPFGNSQASSRNRQEANNS